MDREKGGDFPATGSFPRWLQWLGLSQATARSQELNPGLPPWQPELKYLDHPLLLPRALAGSWINSEAAGTGAGLYVGCWNSKCQLY